MCSSPGAFGTRAYKKEAKVLSSEKRRTLNSARQGLEKIRGRGHETRDCGWGCFPRPPCASHCDDAMPSSRPNYSPGKILVENVRQTNANSTPQSDHRFFTESLAGSLS